MSKKIISIKFDEDKVILNNEVVIDVGMIKKVVFDRDNRVGVIMIEDGGSQIEETISLTSAYALIVFLGTSSWVNL